MTSVAWLQAKHADFGHFLVKNLAVHKECAILDAKMARVTSTDRWCRGHSIALHVRFQRKKLDIDTRQRTLRSSSADCCLVKSHDQKASEETQIDSAVFFFLSFSSKADLLSCRGGEVCE